MINLPTKILLAIKPMRTQFKFTLRLICTPEYKYTPEYIYTRVFFAHANWTLDFSLWSGGGGGGGGGQKRNPSSNKICFRNVLWGIRDLGGRKYTMYNIYATPHVLYANMQVICLI